MTHFIFCKKLKQSAEALSQAPWPGELGQKILSDISLPAWNMWLNHQTMLINEYRLTVSDPKARKFLVEEMKKFLFGEGSEKPPGYN